MWWYTTFQLHKRRESFPIVAHEWVWVWVNIPQTQCHFGHQSLYSIVYSTLSHHFKSLLHISYDVPATMSGILRKQGPIERFLSDIENVDEESLYMGTVWSTNTMGKPPWQ